MSYDDLLEFKLEKGMGKKDCRYSIRTMEN